jgi:hypothetical protein
MTCRPIRPSEEDHSHDHEHEGGDTGYDELGGGNESVLQCGICLDTLYKPVGLAGGLLRTSTHRS